MEIAGETLDIKSVDQDLYFLAAEQDHIAPWRSSYTGARLPSGDVRFVLSNSGHIAGIVNPPNPKSKHWVAPTGELPENPDEWLAEATMHPITWWEDWATWIGGAGRQQDRAAADGQRKHPPLGDAPGTYVFGTVQRTLRAGQSAASITAASSRSTIPPSSVSSESQVSSTCPNYSVSKAIITGGAQGIGAAIAHAARQRGYVRQPCSTSTRPARRRPPSRSPRRPDPRLRVRLRRHRPGRSCDERLRRRPRTRWAAWTPTSATPESPGTRCSTS